MNATATRAPVTAGGMSQSLTTDGLTRMLSHSELQSHLIASVSPEHACRQLINAANRAGGGDNITCMVVQID